MSLLGFPILRYINIEDSEEVLRAIKLTDSQVPINLIIHTPEGLVLAARQIAHALMNHGAGDRCIVRDEHVSIRRRGSSGGWRTN